MLFSRRRVLLTLLTLFISLHAAGQGPAQRQLESDFVEAYCECLRQNESAGPEKLLYSITETCIRAFFTGAERLTQVEKAASERVFEDGLSEYEKGRIIGKDIIFNTIETLVSGCSVYRNALSAYKGGLIAQLKVTPERADSTLADFKKMEAQLQDDKSRGFFYVMLGIVYEYVGNKKEALNAYDRALEVSPSTYAKGLRLLLIREEGY